MIVSSDTFFITGTQNDYIKFSYDFNCYYAGIRDFNFFDKHGYGFGLNLGTSFSYNNILNFDLGIKDLGSIKFNRDVTKIGSKNELEFNGANPDELIDPIAFIDSIDIIFKPQVDSLRKNSIKMLVGTRFGFMASWVFLNTQGIIGPQTLSLLYTQGFSESSYTTIKPKFALALNSILLNHLQIGISSSYGGLSNFGLGALLGVQFKNFRFGLQSDDFTGIVLPDKTTGAGIGVIIQVLL